MLECSQRSQLPTDFILQLFEIHKGMQKLQTILGQDIPQDVSFFFSKQIL